MCSTLQLALCCIVVSVSWAYPSNIYNDINGQLISPSFTSFYPNGSLDTSTVIKQVEYLTSVGVVWFFVCGSSGESVDLTIPERLAYTEAFIAATKKLGGNVIVHVGDDSVENARLLAAHAEKVGAYAISAMPPTYIKPPSITALVATVKYIAAAAPSLPFLYYHIPLLSGVTFKMRPFLEAVVLQVPTFAGIKFTDLDMMDLFLCVSYQPGNYTMLFGRDEQLLSALPNGINGGVGSTYNTMAEVGYGVMRSFAKGDMVSARAYQLCLAEFVAGAEPIATKYDTWLWKHIMDRYIVPVGQMRLPLMPCNADCAAETQVWLKAWCSRHVGYAPKWCENVLVVN